jgi:predicted dehydrogenase
VGVGIGIVGAGGMAMGVLIPYFRAIGQVQLNAVYDIVPEAAHRAAEQHGIVHVHERLEDLIDDPLVEAVCISTPNASHYHAAMMALAAGKHVFCEKPLATSVAEAQEMAECAGEAAERHGVIHTVNFSYRGYPAVRFLRDLIAGGELGEIRHIYALYAVDELFDPRLPVSWRMQARHAGAGPLADIGAHMIDMVRYLCGEIVSLAVHLQTFVPERPDAQGVMQPVDVDDAASLLCSVDNGAMAALHLTGMGGGRNNFQRLELYGSHGSVQYEIDNQRTIQACLGVANLRYHAWSALPVPRQYEGGNHGSVQRAWIESILAGRRVDPLLCPSFEDGLRCQEVLAAAQLAARERRWIDLPLQA